MKSAPASVCLADVADINPWLPTKPKEGDVVSFLGMAAVDAESGTTSRGEARPYGEVSKGYTPFLNDDVLIAKITPCFENCKIAQALIEHPVGFGSTEFHVIRPKPGKADARFLLHFLRQPAILHAGERRMTGSAGQKRVPEKYFAALTIPDLRLDEQRRIADILDRADALRAKRRAALARLDELTQAIFIEMFGNHRQTPVTIGDRLEKSDSGWSWELLTDMGRLATGHTPDRKRSEYWGGHIPWVTLTDIRKLDGSIATQTSEGVTEEGIENSSAVKLPPGTVCFSRTASVGFVTVMGKEMATSQDFVNWVCGPKLDPIFLMHAFLLSRERLRSLSTGSTHKTIYFPTVERFRVLVPPLDLQKSFRRSIEKISAIKSMYHRMASETDALFASLQDRAFRGAL